MEQLKSKPLSKSDESGFYFAQEMLDGDVTSAVNFDRIQKHPSKGYIIFEYLLCEEAQFVNPHTSHPKRYWNKNKRKFLSLWEITQNLKGILYLVNYAKKDTKHEDKILLIEIKNMDNSGITEETLTGMTREEFKEFFRNLNKECL